MQVRQQLGQGIRITRVGWAGAGIGAELAGQVQVVRDRPVLDGQAVLEAEDVDLGKAKDRPVGARPMNAPVWRP